MSGLTEFLLARYDEDEAVAQDVVATLSNDYAASFHPDIGRHIYRWSPARVLADLASKRRIVELASNAAPSWESISDAELLADNILCALAQPYARHPDFRPEWRA